MKMIRRSGLNDPYAVLFLGSLWCLYHPELRAK